MSEAIVSQTDQIAALERNLRNGDAVCIGGIGRHGTCTAHYPPCPYCIRSPLPSPPTDGEG